MSSNSEYWSQEVGLLLRGTTAADGDKVIRKLQLLETSHEANGIINRLTKLFPNWDILSYSNIINTLYRIIPEQ